MYDRIVVPTDGSHAVRKAVQHAINLAQQFDAELLPIYVIDQRMSYHGIFSSEDMQKFQGLGQEAVEYVEELAADADVEASSAVRTGVPYRTITQFAEDTEADLIVMGTHGRTGIERLVLGSTAENVVRTAETPVMTVRMLEAEKHEYED